MKHILFLTTNNLATNPRLVKEVQLALKLKFRVSIIGFILNNWSDSKSMSLFGELKNSSIHAKSNLELFEIEAISSNRFRWLMLGLLEKTIRKSHKFISSNLTLIAYGHSRRSYQIIQKAKKIKLFPDMICAHNLGALYPAYRLSDLWSIPFIFDVEDYHPGESIYYDKGNERKRREFLMRTLLPKATAVTFASPLIEKYSRRLADDITLGKTILNGFNDDEFHCTPLNNYTENLKYVWFSQKIGHGRGLEHLLQVLLMRPAGSKFDLTLIGEIDKDFEKRTLKPFKKQSISSGTKIEILPPLDQKALHQKISEYDVGLALEFDSSDFNREICLTNKIIVYAQAGLFILATATEAQKQFIEKYPQFGILAGQSVNDLNEKIDTIIGLKKQIRDYKSSRIESARSLSWDQEQKKLRSIWEIVLKKIKK